MIILIFYSLSFQDSLGQTTKFQATNPFAEHSVFLLNAVLLQFFGLPPVTNLHLQCHLYLSAVALSIPQESPPAAPAPALITLSLSIHDQLSHITSPVVFSLTPTFCLCQDLSNDSLERATVLLFVVGYGSQCCM